MGWHRGTYEMYWFAWYPVWLVDARQWAWLRTVKRTQEEILVPHGYGCFTKNIFIYTEF